MKATKQELDAIRKNPANRRLFQQFQSWGMTDKDVALSVINALRQLMHEPDEAPALRLVA
jgi:hypothetical protein